MSGLSVASGVAPLEKLAAPKSVDNGGYAMLVGFRVL